MVKSGDFPRSRMKVSQTDQLRHVLSCQSRLSLPPPRLDIHCCSGCVFPCNTAFQNFKIAVIYYPHSVCGSQGFGWVLWHRASRVAGVTPLALEQRRANQASYPLRTFSGLLSGSLQRLLWASSQDAQLQEGKPQAEDGDTERRSLGPDEDGASVNDLPMDFLHDRKIKLQSNLSHCYFWFPLLAAKWSFHLKE